MFIGIEYSELDALIQSFYKAYKCLSSCKKGGVCRGLQNCPQGDDLRAYDQMAFEKLKGKYLEWGSKLPPQTVDKYYILLLEDLENEMKKDPITTWEYDVRIRYKDTGIRGFEDRKTVHPFEDVVKEIELLKNPTEYRCEAIRFYFLQWKLYNWFQRLSEPVESKTKLGKRKENEIDLVPRLEHNTPALNLEELTLLFWHLIDQKTFLADVPRKTIELCFEALTGYSRNQVRKKLHKPEIESEISNPAVFNRVSSLIEKMKTKLEEQRENISH